MTINVLKSLTVALLLGGATMSVTTVHAFPVPKAIGDHYQGGIVFYVDLDGMHGLIAARADQSAGIGWANSNKTTYYNRVTGAVSDGLYAGAMNTAVIIATQMGDNQAGNFAAKVAANYRIQDDGVTACTALYPPASETCYGDWYLPSKVELNLLFRRRAVVGGFALGIKGGVPAYTSIYWSSSESTNIGAFYQDFSGNGGQSVSGKGNTFPIRAVRAF